MSAEVTTIRLWSVWLSRAEHKNVADRSYTILIVPERSSTVRRFKIPHRVLMNSIIGFLAVVALCAFLFIHYIFMVEKAGENTALKNENVMLKTKLRMIQEEIARIDGTLQRISQFSAKIRAITQLNDPDRNLAMAPSGNGSALDQPAVLYAQGERIEYEDELLDSKFAMRMIDTGLDEVSSESLRQEANVHELDDYFAQRATLLDVTPSVRPTSSKLLTSPFGMRIDPYTDQRVMHKGADFAGDQGSDVFAPGDGTVIYVGNRGHGYGKTVVIDHGYGLQTHYSHLSAYKTEIGQKVRRGQVIASVGNTGRSTGAHLHYEVRFNGIPQDPEKFIFD